MGAVWEWITILLASQLCVLGVWLASVFLASRYCKRLGRLRLQVLQQSPRHVSGPSQDYSREEAPPPHPRSNPPLP